MPPEWSNADVRFLTEDEFSRWRQFVDDSPAGSVYSYPEYLDTLCTVLGGSFRVLGVYRGEEIHGGIALYERPGSGGMVLSGRLLLYYNGIVLREFQGKYPSRRISRQLAVTGALAEALAALGHAHVHIRNRHPITDLRPFLRSGWSVQPSYSHLLSFPDPGEAFERVEQNQRRLIRRCKDEGGVLTSDDDFESFYRFHEGTSQRKGAPLYLPKERFRDYFMRLSAQGLVRLYQVRMKEGPAVASQMVLLGAHPVTHTVSAGADPDFLKAGTTPFLRWEVCLALAAEGYTGNDLTDASLNQVTRFKRALGAELVVNLVLKGPDNLPYRLARLREEAYRKARGAAGRLVRKLRKA